MVWSRSDVMMRSRREGENQGFELDTELELANPLRVAKTMMLRRQTLRRTLCMMCNFYRWHFDGPLVWCQQLRSKQADAPPIQQHPHPQSLSTAAAAQAPQNQAPQAVLQLARQAVRQAAVHAPPAPPWWTGGPPSCGPPHAPVRLRTKDVIIPQTKSHQECNQTCNQTCNMRAQSDLSCMLSKHKRLGPTMYKHT